MANSDELDVIVVGAGLAGLACAYQTAGAGLQTIVLERGDAPGSKSLSGGRMYVQPIHEMGDFLEDIPYERPVVSESITLTDPGAGVSLRYDNGFVQEKPNSVTVLLSPLVKRLAEKVTAKGALLLNQQKADGLLRENGRVVGVKVGKEELRARQVVAADGVLSFLALEAGLRAERPADIYGLGIKEIIELDSARIEDRFNLPSGQGAARLFMGTITQGLPGGGFIYTNKNSLSLGIVINLQALADSRFESETWEILELFKNRPDIAPLLSGGKTVEYGAHLIPEGGFANMPAPGIPGLLLAGDAAGFVLNTGFTLRGMDLAIASGILAGRSIAASHKQNFSPEACLAHYERALRESFVIRQMKAFKRAPDVLALKRLYDRYPQRMVDLLREMFQVDAAGRSISPWSAARTLIFKILGWRGVRDLWRLARMGS